MIKKLAYIILGVITGLFIGSIYNSVKAADLDRTARIELLTNATGLLKYEGDRTCSFSKIGPNTFLTARHCVVDRDPSKFLLTFKLKDSDFYSQDREPSSIEVATKSDLAVLRTESDIDDMKPLVLACEKTIVLGQSVSVMGFPNPMGRFYSEGYVASVSKTDLGDQVNSNFFADVRVSFGSSGGPMIDATTGEQIGVMSELILPQRVGALTAGAEGISIIALCPKGQERSVKATVKEREDNSSSKPLDPKDYGGVF